MKLHYFDLEEFACPCCGFNNINKEFVKLLDNARSRAGLPFIINSGSRCSKHNHHVKGSPTSSHKLGLAADIRCEDSMSRLKIVESLLKVGISRIGIYENFIHCDVDPNKHNAMWVNP